MIPCHTSEAVSPAAPTERDFDLDVCIRDLDAGRWVDTAQRLAVAEPALEPIFATHADAPWLPGFLRGVVAELCHWVDHPRYGEQVTLAWDALWPWASHATDVKFWAQIGVHWAACEPLLTAEQAYPLAEVVTALHARACTAAEFSALVELAAALARVTQANQIDHALVHSQQMYGVARAIEAWTQAGGDADAAWVNCLFPFFVNRLAPDTYRELLRALKRAEALGNWHLVPEARQRQLTRFKLHLLGALRQPVGAAKVLTAALERPHDCDREAVEEWGILACNLVHALRCRKGTAPQAQDVATVVHRWLDWVGDDASWAAQAEVMRAHLLDDSEEHDSAAECWAEVARVALAEGRRADALDAMHCEWIAQSHLLVAESSDEDAATRWDEQATKLTAKAMTVAEADALNGEVVLWGIRKAQQLARNLDEPEHMQQVRQVLLQVEGALHDCDDERRADWRIVVSDLWRRIEGGPAVLLMN